MSCVFFSLSICVATLEKNPPDAAGQNLKVKDSLLSFILFLFTSDSDFTVFFLLLPLYLTNNSHVGFGWLNSSGFRGIFCVEFACFLRGSAGFSPGSAALTPLQDDASEVN